MKRKLLQADKKTTAERVDVEVSFKPSARAWFTFRSGQREAAPVPVAKVLDPNAPSQVRARARAERRAARQARAAELAKEAVK